MYIEDGKGSGKNVGVDSANRLLVSASSSFTIALNSKEQGNAYSMYFKHDVVAGATNEYAGYLVYTGVRALVVAQAVCCATITSGVGVIDFFVKSTYTSGGNAIATPINLNSSSSNILNITGYNAYPTPIVGSVGNNFITTRLAPNFPTLLLDLKDSVILTTGKTLGIQIKSPTIGDSFSVILHVFEEDI